MNITEIIYRAYYWATTNPPINQSTTTSVFSEGGKYFLLDVKEENGALDESKYELTEEQFGAVCGKAEELNIIESIEKLNALNVPEPMMVGGASGSTIAITADGSTIVTGKSDEAISQFIKELLFLRDSFKATAQGEWVCENCGFKHNKGNFCTECGSAKK